ncbi:MAG: zinc ribbon domain-containing protein [Ruminiclostridium sp.]|nr:zinc ribbon domain-containing protein [Ruminiclostridium sp.]
MECPKCGENLPNDAVFCAKCGTKLTSPVQSYTAASEPSGAAEPQKTNESVPTWTDLLKGLFGLLKTVFGKLIIVAVVIMVGVVVIKSNPQWFSGIDDQISNIVQKDDPNIQMVKNGSPYTYPNITYDQAFSAFFTMPTWKYFTGKLEGPDDDGDGKPDYTKSNVEIVEFTGRCQYKNKDVKARIQFILDKKNGTFTTSYLALNEVPQSNLLLISLIDKAFGSYKKPG